MLVNYLFLFFLTLCFWWTTSFYIYWFWFIFILYMYILYIYLYIFIYLYLFVFIYLYLLRHLEENVIPMRRKLAKEVSVKGWDKSPHVGHLRWNRTFKNLSPIWYSDHQNKEFSKLPKNNPLLILTFLIMTIRRAHSKEYREEIRQFLCTIQFISKWKKWWRWCN